MWSTQIKIKRLTWDPQMKMKGLTWNLFYENKKIYLKTMKIK
jgi:hypothetical protein